MIDKRQHIRNPLGALKIDSPSRSARFGAIDVIPAVRVELAQARRTLRFHARQHTTKKSIVLHCYIMILSSQCAAR